MSVVILVISCVLIDGASDPAVGINKAFKVMREVIIGSGISYPTFDICTDAISCYV